MTRRYLDVDPMRLENAITPEQVIMATMDQIRNTVSDFDLERMPTISASPLQRWPSTLR